MRLTMRTNLAMRVLMYCAVNGETVVRKQDIAEACNASQNHLASVVATLAAADLLATSRGRGGGIRLARRPEDIALGPVFRQLEGCVPFAECFEGAVNTCPLCDTCRLRGVLGRALEAFYQELDSVTLRDLIEDNDGLRAILLQEAA